MKGSVLTATQRLAMTKIREGVSPWVGSRGNPGQSRMFEGLERRGLITSRETFNWTLTDAGRIALEQGK